MDEGRAALYAAIIGLAAVIIGAAVGGWVTWKAARHGADAALRATMEQLSGQAINERNHWVRQERRAAYATVIDAYMSVSMTAAAHRSGLREETPEVYERLAELGVACKRLTLFGPDSVEEAASELLRRADDRVRRPSEAGVSAGGGTALNGFLAACKDALSRDNEGDE
ncbi:hypothetical protein [Streptomyces nigrescens]|uniref:Uncharacterized protein n=1 Tax=Streptomyces nigrescens TaxID=1920 RepID=A0A640TB06_STRNI|nr:hypothetical protein [Streptomyces libani]WAT95197.1 hypothetical protein STRLI_000886 [Streptomyces libani subsp. libani]GFE20380.1 hypothetical protein Sliba_08330 [Streptomyces libani subsp. libani]GGV86819.1 hypothetical protein GCM10010500_05770 [Streptomyces libani subsp. libani]